jgi:hypothetical protein
MYSLTPDADGSESGAVDCLFPNGYTFRSSSSAGRGLENSQALLRKLVLVVRGGAVPRMPT